MKTQQHFDQPYYDSQKHLLLIPQPTLIILCGPSGCGKSTFASTHFPQTSIVSSDNCRSIISDDVRNMECSAEAFDLLYTIIHKRLKLGRTTVVDSTALTSDSRQKLRVIAEQHNFLTLLLVLNTPRQTCYSRDNARIWPTPVGRQVLNQQFELFDETLRQIKQEGFDAVVVLENLEINKVSVRVEPLAITLDREVGKFDIFGDIQGCITELHQLLLQLGYLQTPGSSWRNLEQRKAIFAGDLIGYGPSNLDILQLVSRMVKDGNAFYVPGKNCYNFYRYIKGQETEVKSGLEAVIAEYGCLDAEKQQDVAKLLEDLIANKPPYLIANNGNLAVAYAGVKAEMQGRISPQILEFCLYNASDDWIADYNGKPLVAYNSAPTPYPHIVNNTINLNQGCVYGGKLTAMRYPEMIFEQVEAQKVYYSLQDQKLEKILV